LTLWISFLFYLVISPSLFRNLSLIKRLLIKREWRTPVLWLSDHLFEFLYVIVMSYRQVIYFTEDRSVYFRDIGLF